MNKPILDLISLSEDQRITLIGTQAMKDKSEEGVGFIVDDDAKADRYIEKMKKEFPGIRVVLRMIITPESGLVFVRMGPPVN